MAGVQWGHTSGFTVVSSGFDGPAAEKLAKKVDKPRDRHTLTFMSVFLLNYQIEFYMSVDSELEQ